MLVTFASASVWFRLVLLRSATDIVWLVPSASICLSESADVCLNLLLFESAYVCLNLLLSESVALSAVVCLIYSCSSSYLCNSAVESVFVCCSSSTSVRTSLLNLYFLLLFVYLCSDLSVVVSAATIGIPVEFQRISLTGFAAALAILKPERLKVDKARNE
ncbi:hypothetical protein Tco_0317121 [Tanacetum coccineum]